MKRTMATAMAIGALSVAVLTGCNRAKAEAPAPVPATTATVTPAAGAAADTTTGTAAVDGLLNQIDSQLKADGQAQPDSD
jgi:uncharacterized lipoprotein YbaY